MYLKTTSTSTWINIADNGFLRSNLIGFGFIADSTLCKERYDWRSLPSILKISFEITLFLGNKKIYQCSQGRASARSGSRAWVSRCRFARWCFFRLRCRTLILYWKRLISHYLVLNLPRIPWTSVASLKYASSDAFIWRTRKSILFPVLVSVVSIFNLTPYSFKND